MKRLAMILTAWCACTPDEAGTRLENAAAVKQYDDALLDCKRRGADAGNRFDVFADCARAVDRELCRGSEGLRREWPRCKEVLP
jgi:hypothetical protein